MGVDIRLLGGFSVTVDDRPVPASAWQRRSASALVKLLALQPGRRLRREQVIDALWPDLLVDEAAPRLHKATHYARTALVGRDSVVLAGDAVTLLPEEHVTVDAAGSRPPRRRPALTPDVRRRSPTATPVTSCPTTSSIRGPRSPGRGCDVGIGSSCAPPAAGRRWSPSIRSTRRRTSH